jgi:hypothetical protein
VQIEGIRHLSAENSVQKAQLSTCHYLRMSSIDRFDSQLELESIRTKLTSVPTLRTSTREECPHYAHQQQKSVHITHINNRRVSTLRTLTTEECPHYAHQQQKNVHITHINNRSVHITHISVHNLLLMPLHSQGMCIL